MRPSEVELQEARTDIRATQELIAVLQASVASLEQRFERDPTVGVGHSITAKHAEIRVATDHLRAAHSHMKKLVGKEVEATLKAQIREQMTEEAGIQMTLSIQQTRQEILTNMQQFLDKQRAENILTRVLEWAATKGVLLEFKGEDEKVDEEITQESEHVDFEHLEEDGAKYTGELEREKDSSS